MLTFYINRIIKHPVAVTNGIINSNNKINNDLVKFIQINQSVINLYYDYTKIYEFRIQSNGYYLNIYPPNYKENYPTVLCKSFSNINCFYNKICILKKLPYDELVIIIQLYKFSLD